ncbi:MAG: CapA family protein [Clostridia bacterium]|nr:CapA family protein [Clostridia bacterium]
MKKWLLMLLAVLLLMPALNAPAEMLRGYEKGQGYQYVLLGEYPYEKDGTEAPVLWRILDVDDGKALLLTEYIIDTQQAIFETDQKVIENRTYRRLNHYEESDLCPWLDTEMVDRLFDGDQIIRALIKENGSRVFILTSEQFLTTDYGFSANMWNEQKSRQAVGTPYCIKQRNLYVDRSINKSPYWAATIKDPDDYKLQLIGYNGHLSWGAYTRVNVGLRLSVRLDLSQLEITGGSGTKDHPFTLSYVGTPATPVPTVVPTRVPATELPVKATPAAATQAPEEKATEMPAQAGVPAVQPGTPVITVVQIVTQSPADNAPAAAVATPAPAATKAPAAAEIPAATLEPTQAPSPVPTEEPRAESGAITLSFVGDCSIGDSEQYTQSTNSYHNTIDAQGYGWPFSLVKDYLTQDDLTIANLEVVFTKRTKHADKMYNLIADPDHVQVLIDGSVEMVNTVNNHCMDFMQAGYEDSIACLDQAGIARFGTVYPGKPHGFDDLGIQDVGDIRIGFIGFTYPQDSDQKRIASRIKTLKENEGCDLVIVSLHWGRETHMTPESWQIAYAKEVIKAGADAIWGHHPHVIQPIQFYQGKPIMYSTGNFTFGTMSKVDPSTGIFQLTYEKVDGKVELKQMQVIPCKTQGSPDYRPYEVTDPAERREIFDKLTFNKDYKNCQNPPASFLETGIIQFENGQMLP